jgi:putative membrane protein
MWKSLLIRYLVILVALAAAVWLVPGITVEGDAVPVVLLMGLVLGLVNILVKPILKFFSCGCIVLTLGLFLLVVNALALWFASWLAQLLGIGFVVDGFWSAFWGGLVISVVSFLMNMLIPDKM